MKKTILKYGAFDMFRIEYLKLFRYLSSSRIEFNTEKVNNIFFLLREVNENSMVFSPTVYSMNSLHNTIKTL